MLHYIPYKYEPHRSRYDFRTSRKALDLNAKWKDMHDDRYSMFSKSAWFFAPRAAGSAILLYVLIILCNRTPPNLQKLSQKPHLKAKSQNTMHSDLKISSEAWAIYTKSLPKQNSLKISFYARVRTRISGSICFCKSACLLPNTTSTSTVFKPWFFHAFR